MIVFGFVLGGIWWITESAIHSFVFDQGYFFQQLVPQDTNELWMRLLIFILFVFFGFYANFVIHEIQKIEMEKETLRKQVEYSLTKMLSGFIPICAGCKKIRDEKGTWDQLEAYISKHTDAEFSHGICPECNKKYYGDSYSE